MFYGFSALPWVYCPPALIDFITWVEHWHISSCNRPCSSKYHLNFIFNGPSDIKTWPSIILFLPSTFSWLHLTSLWLLCLRYKMLPINCDLWTSNYINSGMWSQTLTGFQCFNTIHNEDSWLDQLTNVLHREWERLEYYEREWSYRWFIGFGQKVIYVIAICLWPCFIPCFC